MTDITEAEARDLAIARIGQVRLAQDSAIQSVDGLWWTDNRVWERITGGGAQFDIKVVSDLNTVATGDGQFIFEIPTDLDGFTISYVRCYVTTVSSSGALSIMLHNITSAIDILSTAITIDVSELSSKTAAVPPVIGTGIVAEGDQIRIDVDSAGTGAKGLGAIIGLS
jgi:hypothetical protein